MQPNLALIEPEIAGNVGTILRTAACFGVPVHIVEPCGFAFSDRALRRAGMDYAASAALTRHESRSAFVATARAQGRRLVLLTTGGGVRLDEAQFTPADILMLGSEGSGAPADMHDAAALRVRIPLCPAFRSLNVAVAAGIALAEALRQLKGFPQ
ncbi:MAG: tRNA (cytidine(34)-2'-O)-methyltransferase [Sphingopyxis sp.]